MRAYPRLRGEHHVRGRHDDVPLGLPPLARGAPLAQLVAGSDLGPTPACAGSTTASRSATPGSGAYPRLRGEHMMLARAEQVETGLPPLARGAQPVPPPAAQSPMAYPRLRGEHMLRDPVPSWGPGLPPLARGAPSMSNVGSIFMGPTPACAGSTRSGAPGAPSIGAYPRLRGEHRVGGHRAGLVVGLPPLARGAPRPEVHVATLAGPTPACAGSTASSKAATRRERAYPRLRGEHQW